MKRILFVDDEAPLLEGLRNALRRRRKEWDLHFALGGEAGLAALREGAFDIVVSDLRMPGVDGVAVLRRAREERPGAIRIVLSGHAEMDLLMRALPVAHQYLSKPIETARLQGVLERACHMRDLMQDEGLCSVVGGADSLPPLPRVYTVLTRMLADPKVSLRDVSQVVEQDVAISAKLLHLANSGLFGAGQRLMNVQAAVKYLGTSIITSLVLSAEVFQLFQDAPHTRRSTLERIHQHALVTAKLAAQILPHRESIEDVYAAGVLHDIGYLLLAARGHEVRSPYEGPTQPVAEPEGPTHAEVGGYLLGMWGLPVEVVEAVTGHHRPLAQLNGRGAIHLADLLLHDPPAMEGEMGTLEALGLARHVQRWRALAGELLDCREPPGGGGSDGDDGNRSTPAHALRRR